MARTAESIGYDSLWVFERALFLDEIFLDLQGDLRDAEELKDVAAEVYESACAAGV